MLTFDGYHNVYYCDIRVGSLTFIPEVNIWIGIANVFDQWIERRAHSAEDLLTVMNEALSKMQAHTATGDLSWSQH